MTDDPPTGALVTGGGARIGRAIARALAAEGRAVAVHYNRSQEQAFETVADIREAGGRAVAVQADFADPAAALALIPSAVQALAELASDLGCLVNNASHFSYDDIGNVGAADFDRHMAVNVRAPALLTRAFAAHIGETHPKIRGAVIVNIIDQKIANPDPDYLSYTLSKHALDGLTKAAALALAPDIRVVGVAPGLALASPAQSEGEFERAAAKLPFGRATSVADIATTVCYVASAPSITGQTILVDSGQHLQARARDIAFELDDSGHTPGT